MSNRLILYISMLFAGLFLVSCDVHEFPEIPEAEPVDVTVHLDFNLELPPYKEILYETGVPSRFSPSEPYDIRYVVNVYRSANGKDFTRIPYKTMLLSKDDIEELNHDFTIGLPPGHYRFYVWADYAGANSLADRYYTTNDFSEITLQGTHVGCDDYRDAFRGDEITDVIEGIDNEVYVSMSRPMAKYKFVATDFEKFYTRAEEAARSRMMQQGRLPAADTDDSRSVIVDLDEYTVRFRYTGFMPHIYNMFTDKPSDAKTGVSFTGKLTKVSDSEAELGFDYVFVNGQEALVQVSVEIYDPDGILISSSGAINVPLSRSKLTVVKGAFLTSQTSGGVGISPEFDGEFNIVVP